MPEAMSMATWPFLRGIAGRQAALKHRRRATHATCRLLAEPDIGLRVEWQQDDVRAEPLRQLVAQGSHRLAQLGRAGPRANADADAARVRRRTVFSEDLRGVLRRTRL